MTEITKEKFNAYRSIQYSGVTNMFAISMVMELSGLTRAEVLAIMNTYNKLEIIYGKFQEVVK